MTPFEIADEYTDAEDEQRLLASMNEQPELFWELAGEIGPDVFAGETQGHAHADVYVDLREAVEDEKAPPPLPGEWPARAADRPHRTAENLRDLWQRRQLARLVQNTASSLRDEEQSAGDILSEAEGEAARLQQVMHEDTAGEMAFPDDLLDEVLSDAREAREHYEETGDTISGVKTGFSKLDQILGGLPEGLTLLAGGPGTGKTTLALQLARTAASEVPALYVTFENSPTNLTLRGLCAAADPAMNAREVQRGLVPIPRVRDAAKTWRRKASRLAIIEGRTDLTTAAVRGKAKRLMNRFDAERCLILVDYLQLWAKASREFRGLTGVRERVEVMGSRLREMAMKLNSPILAIASQNRATGGYGGSSGGSASLSSLKESGDLEYGADAALFLTEDKGDIAAGEARALALTVAKNRYGETGRLRLVFRPDVGTMRPKNDRPGPPDGQPF